MKENGKYEPLYIFTREPVFPAFFFSIFGRGFWAIWFFGGILTGFLAAYYVDKCTRFLCAFVVRANKSIDKQVTSNESHK